MPLRRCAGIADEFPNCVFEKVGAVNIRVFSSISFHVAVLRIDVFRCVFKIFRSAYVYGL